VSGTITDIPFPSNTTTTFDPWLETQHVRVSWNYNNPHNVAGRFYLYRREGTSGTWTAIANANANVAATNGANQSGSFSQNIIVSDFNKSFQYMVAFVEGATATTSRLQTPKAT